MASQAVDNPSPGPVKSDPGLRVTRADVDRYIRHRAGTDDIRRLARETRKLAREAARIKRAGDRAAMAALARRILFISVN